MSHGLAGIGLLMQQARRCFSNFDYGRRLIAGRGCQDEGGEGGAPVWIKSIVPGGSCDRDGFCQVNDIIIAVNGEKVATLPVVQVREKIVGPTGSTVVIIFQRENGEFYERTLVRGTPAYFEENSHPNAVRGNVLSTSISSGYTSQPTRSQETRERAMANGNDGNEGDASDRRLPETYKGGHQQANQIDSTDPEGERSKSAFGRAASGNRIEATQPPATSMQQFMTRSLDARLLTGSTGLDGFEKSSERRRPSAMDGELSIVNHELARTRELLEQDRALSMNYVREIDAMQRKNADQVMQLQSLLNQSEQIRKDLENQVSNTKARENEFQVAFSRAREQNEAREKYFADLKKHFETSVVTWEEELAKERNPRLEAERERDQATEEYERLRKDLQAMKSLEKARGEREAALLKRLQEAEEKFMACKKTEERARGQFQAMHLQMSQWQNDYFGHYFDSLPARDVPRVIDTEETLLA